MSPALVAVLLGWLCRSASAAVQIGALGLGYQGPGGIGACCLPAGVCIALRQDICEEVGGTYQGDDIPCEPDPCTPTSIERRTWGEIKASFR